MRACLILFFFFTGFCSSAQQPATIHFRKDTRKLIFFKIGAKSDSIANNTLFYLFVSDTLQPYVYLEVYNARLNCRRDTIYTLQYMAGMKYLSDFRRASRNFTYTTMVDGSSGLPGRQVLIRIFDRRDDELLLENRYYIVP